MAKATGPASSTGQIATAAADKYPLIGSLLRSNQFAAALTLAERAVRAEPGRGAAHRMVYLAQMGLREFGQAAASMVRALEVQPDNSYYRRLLAMALKDDGDVTGALPILERLLAAHPDDIELLDAMVVCYHRLRERARAVACGQRKLDLLDAAVVDIAPERGLSPMGLRKVVSFSLWGADDRYCIGALANAATIGKRLPGWTARFYLGPGVPTAIIARLKALAAEVMADDLALATVPAMMRRFLIHDHPDVDRYLCRDCDSRIGAREVAAISDWTERDRPFHIVRDHPFHHELIHGGLWGGRANRRFSIAPLILDYQARNLGEARYGNDQRFLRESIYPRIRGYSLIHDSHYRLPGSRPIPGGEAGDDRDHIGMGIVGGERLRTEAEGMAQQLRDPGDDH